MNVLDDILGGAPPKPNTVPVKAIRTDGGTQMRAAINWDTVYEYRDAMREGATLPPPVVYFDGEYYWVGDGFHRIAAWKLVHQMPGAPGEYDTQVIDCDVRPGTRRDAVLHAAGANASHGLRRGQADKRRSVETLLRDEEWRQWSDREIARKCNVSADLVGAVRKELYPPEPVTVGNDSERQFVRTFTTKHGTQATMQTAAIGKTQPSYAPVWQIERTVSSVIEETWPNAAATQSNIAELRNAAAAPGCAFMKAVESELDASDIEFRRQDLVQAINNVASQMEQALSRPAASPEYRTASEMYQQYRSERDAQPSPTAKPNELPADLAARGWELRRVGGVGKYYCNNANGPRATGVYDKAGDAIAEAYTMQVDLLAAPAGQPTPTAQLRSSTSDDRSYELITNAMADLLIAKNTIATDRPEAAQQIENALELLRDAIQEWNN